MKSMKLTASLAALAVVLSLGAARAAPSEEEVLQQVFSAVADQVGPSVVAIEIVKHEPKKKDEEEKKHTAPPKMGMQTHRGVRPPKRTKGGSGLGSGPVTGLIISPDGYILSSSFKLAGTKKKDKINVIFSDGRKLPAVKLGSDFTRSVVLLKVEAQGLPVPETIGRNEVWVGQWALALGKGLTEDQLELKVGIISAKDRVMGKVYQTDIKTSPSNYGAPVCDIRGRVIGILVPLSGRSARTPLPKGIKPKLEKKLILPKKDLPKKDPDKDKEPGKDKDPDKEVKPQENNPGEKPKAVPAPEEKEKKDDKKKTARKPKKPRGPKGPTGNEALQRYDVGIAFIAPIKDVLRGFEKMKAGENVLAGAIGVSSDVTNEQFQEGAKIKGVSPDSPAQKAGIKEGDIVIKAVGLQIRNFRNLQHIVGRYNAGDEVDITVKRGDEILEMTMKLVPRSEIKPIPKPKKKDDEDKKEDGDKKKDEDNTDDQKKDDKDNTDKPDEKPKKAG